MNERSGAESGKAGNGERLQARLGTSPEALAAFCERWHVSELALFGSILRDEFGPESDIDMLVTFSPGGTPGLAFVSMADELSDMLGRPVDVLTRPSVERSRNYIRRKAILEAAEVIYAAG
ncbi:MAG: nucleotidyltransferase family protein [Rhodospirillaceae bacterium]|nr:nucleotidyltransferase family protein [Rhodospirillaceae bacterium]